MPFIRRNTKILFILVFPVYFYIVQSSILNKHTHFYPNGMVVTHSHPTSHEDGAPIDDHKHSKTEICFYSLEKIDLFTFSQNLNIDFSNIEVDKNFVDLYQTHTYSTHFLISVPRGPPNNLA